MPAAYRTPDERFEGLPDFDFEPHYRTVGDLRLAHLDVGEGPPVVMLHGEPAWSFIWRKVIPPVRDGGYRCVVPDHAGFGRSDKPADPGWQSLQHHVDLTASLLEDLDLRDVTLVGHDWGGPISANVALAYPDRVARMVFLDTILDPREAWLSERWMQFREFVEHTADFPVGELMSGTCVRELSEAVIAGYEAPFPVPESKAALTGLPMSVPRVHNEEILAAMDRLVEALKADPRPVQMIWGESDLILTLLSGERLASRIGRRINHAIPQAGHGIQEDQGELVGRLIAEFAGGD